ncbi:MAG: hypothetical protein EHM42_07130, partial [Planctomycetaceae bacterium]
TEAEAQRTLAALRPRFVREAELTAQLDHPGVVPIHEIGTDSNGLVYFTMRLVDGTRLDTLFEQFQERDPVWTRSRILDVIVKICETLAYAHSKGIIHRDLKPENIMVGRFGETYVMDWGLAKCLRAATRADAAEPEAAAAGATSNSQASATSVVSEAEFDTDTLAGSVLGTAAFMPPEQATGRIREVDERSDIYAVGGMLYQLLTRRRPYTTDPPLRPEDIVKAVTMGPPASIISLNPRAQPELMAICEKAMARDKALRYETMQAMADDLRAYLENRVVKAHRTGAGAELRKWVSRNVGVAVTSALALLTALVGLGAIVVLQSVANEKLKSSNDTVSAQRDELEKTNETVSAQRDELVNAYREKDEAFENEQIARKLAEDERTKTEAIALARESASALSSNPGQALRLALESTSRSATLPGATAAWSAIQDCREIRTLRVHRSEVRALAVSPTGEHFATASTDSVVVIWDGKTLAPRFLLSGSHVLTPILQFSPDGAVLAVTDSDGVVSLWNPRTGRLFGELPTGENRHVVCLCFSPDGTRLACGTTNGRIQIWSVQQMVELATHKRHTDGIQVAAFSPDGRVLVTGGRDGQLMIWDAQTGDLLQQVTAHVTGVGFLEFSPDGKQLVSGPLVDDLEGAASGADARPEPREARLWNTADFALVKDIPHGAVTTSAAFSSDGLHLFTAGVDGALCTWQLPGLARIDRGVVAKGPIKSLKIGADGRYVTTLRNDATVAVIDRRRGREFSFQRHDA